MQRYFSVFVVMLVLVTGCVDKADPDYAKCVQADAAKQVDKAWAACNAAVNADPSSKSGVGATTRLAAMKPAYDAWKKAEDARQAEAAKAKAEADAAAAKIRYHSMAKKLNDKIHQQAAWDIGRGTVTNVIDVMTGEMGQPTGTYEGGFGAVLSFVWGAHLGDSPTVDQIEGAPFCARMPRGLTCGDYAEGSVEFYADGEQIRFWLPE